MKTLYFAICLCTTVLAFASGCASPKPRDRLPVSEGWRRLLTAREIGTIPTEVIENYKAYIQKLPAKERNQLTEGSVHFFENPDGRHAVHFEIGRDAFIGVSEIIYAHVLVYDQSNKRVKVMKYRSRSRLLL
jgi:hypothetical protein